MEGVEGEVQDGEAINGSHQMMHDLANILADVTAILELMPLLPTSRRGQDTFMPDTANGYGKHGPAYSPSTRCS